MHILIGKQFVSLFLKNIILPVLLKKENVQTMRSYTLNIPLHFLTFND